MLLLPYVVFLTQSPIAVSYTTPPKAARAVFQEISKSTGRSLSIGNSLAQEVLQIQVKDMPLPKLKKHLAEVLGGEWAEEGGESKLSRSAAAARAFEAEDIRLEAAQIANHLAKSKASLAKPYTLDNARRIVKMVVSSAAAQSAKGEEPEEVLEPSDELPVKRALMRTLLTIPASTIAALPARGRIVFSNIPTRMQRPLGMGATTILQQLANEQSIAARVREELPESQTFYREALQPLAGPPVRLLLAIHREDSRIDARLVVLDEGARVLVEAGRSVSGRSGRFPGLSGAPSKPGDLPIDFGPNGRTILNALKQMDLQSTSPLEFLPSTLREEFLNPEKHDPLSFVVGPALSAVAGERPLVANVPDGVLAFTMFAFASQKLTASGLQHVLLATNIASFRESEGILIIRPVSFSRRRNSRVSREAYGQFARSIARQGFASLDSVASVIHSSAPSDLGDMPPSLFFMFLLAGDELSDALSAIDLLRFWGSLSAAQKQTLMEGGTLFARTLLPNQYALLSDFIYHSNPDQPVLLHRGNDEVKEAEASSFVAGRGATALQRVDEPTELLPNGVPGAAGIVLALADTDLLTFPSNDEGRRQMSLEIGAVASHVAAQEIKGPEEARRSFNLENVRHGTRRAFSFAIELSPTLTALGSLSETKKGKTWNTLENLPPPVKARYQKHLEEARKALADAPSRPKSGPPPPATRAQ